MDFVTYGMCPPVRFDLIQQSVLIFFDLSHHCDLEKMKAFMKS